MKLEIHITKEVLEKSAMCGFYPGTRQTEGNNVSENCAVAIAVRDIFPDAAIGPETIHTFGTNCPYNMKIEMPLEARAMIMQFDNFRNSTDHRYNKEDAIAGRKAMEPMSFVVDVPDVVIDKIGINEVHEAVKKSKTLELVN